jgi:signal transduction histidine kinase
VRRRIVGLTVLAAVLATCLFGVPLAVVAGHYFVSDEKRELERTADITALAVSGDLRKAGQVGGLPAHEPGIQVSVFTSAGERVTGPEPAGATKLIARTQHGAVASGNLGNRMAVAVPVSDGDTIVGAVLVSVDRGQVYWRDARSWLGMLALAAAAVLVTWLLARRQARRLAAPLEQLAATAERLGDGDFSLRTTAHGITEIDSVSTSLDRTAARLGELVERERAFSADASHQLRTPLTGLQLGLEAALATPSADLRAALSDALDTARQLEGTVADLLALARDQPREGAPLDLDALLDDVRARWNGPLAVANRPLRVVRGSGTPRTDMSRPALSQVLDVLLENALRHGRGAVSVTARDAEGALAIDVSDEGSMNGGDSRELFRRRSHDAQGTGIGLALARRLTEAEGGRLVLSARQPTRFTVLAPPHRDAPSATTDRGR